MTDNLQWRKSTYSGKDECVEVAFIEEERAEEVGIRDSKNLEGGHFVVPAPAFRGFLDAVKRHKQTN